MNAQPVLIIQTRIQTLYIRNTLLIPRGEIHFSTAQSRLWTSWGGKCSHVLWSLVMSQKKNSPTVDPGIPWFLLPAGAGIWFQYSIYYYSNSNTCVLYGILKSFIKLFSIPAHNCSVLGSRRVLCVVYHSWLHLYSSSSKSIIPKTEQCHCSPKKDYWKHSLRFMIIFLIFVKSRTMIFYAFFMHQYNLNLREA